MQTYHNLLFTISLKVRKSSRWFGRKRYAHLNWLSKHRTTHTYIYIVQRNMITIISKSTNRYIHIKQKVDAKIFQNSNGIWFICMCRHSYMEYCPEVFSAMCKKWDVSIWYGGCCSFTMCYLRREFLWILKRNLKKII